MSLFGRWIEAGAEEEFADQDRRELFLEDGRSVAVFKVEGTYYAVANTCTHARAALLPGLLEGHEIECPLHGARFDLRTGRNTSPPATPAVATYPTRVRDGRVQVKV